MRAFLIFLALLPFIGAVRAADVAKPNVVFILCDDLGYGDVHCLNPDRCKIATPQIDRMAAEGVTFTDAHSSSSVCTPTRYSIMTGRYNWRTRLQSGVLKLSPEVQKHVEGRSLLPLLKNPKSEWADRTLVHHVGRWAKGKASESKFSNCSIQNSRFTLVKNAELYDLQNDPGESKNVIADHPEVVAKLRSAYDQWWDEVQPLLVNEEVTDIPKINPMKELYWKQFGGEPDEAMLKKMDPSTSSAGKTDPSAAQSKRQKRRDDAKK